MDHSSTVTERAGGDGPGTRIVGVDLARAFALLGMMVIHVLPRIEESTGEATAVGLVAAGRPSALFAVLAGVGLALLTGGRAPAPGRRGRTPDRRLGAQRLSITVRALLIVVIGLVIASWETQVAIILVHYGLLFLLALPVLRLGARSLMVLAGAWTLLAPVVFRQVVLALLQDPAYPGDLRLWHSPGLSDVIDEPGLTALDLTVTGYYPLLIWPAYLLVGLAVGRCALDRRSVAWRLTGLGTLLAGLSAVVSWTTLLTTDLTADFDYYGEGEQAVRAELLTGTLLPVEADPRWHLVATPHSGSTMDLVHTIGSALLVLGVCLLVTSAAGSRGRLVLSPLIGAGAMPLTLYVGHLAVLHPWRAEGWPLNGLSMTAMVLLLTVLALGGGAVKYALGRRGPLEALVHAAGNAAVTAAAPPRRR